MTESDPNMKFELGIAYMILLLLHLSFNFLIIASLSLIFPLYRYFFKRKKIKRKKIA